MANNCSITLKADKLPKVITKVEYFLFKAMEQNNISFFQIAENPGNYLATLLPVARNLIDAQIKDYIKKASSAEAKQDQEVADAYSKFAANLQNITANWNQVSASMSVYSSIFKTKTKFKLDEDGMVDLSQLADDEDAIYKKFIVDQAANEIDPLDTIDKAVEIFIRSIPRDALIPDEYGFTSNIDYSSFVRNLMADLEGAVGIEEIIQKLQDNLEKTPEYRHIIDMLQFTPTDNSRQLQLKINFRNSFAKANIPIYTTSIEGDVIKVFEATVARRSKYEQNVESNFVLRGMPVEVNGQVINLAHLEDGTWIVDKSDAEKIKDFLDPKLVAASERTNRKIQFLKALGFSFTPVTEELIRKKIEKNDNEKKPEKIFFDYIYNHFLNRITEPSVSDYYGTKGETDVITNPIYALKKDWNKFGTGQNNIINTLIETELKYNPVYNIERSVINPEGNRQHSTQLNNNFTVLNKYLSDVELFPNDPANVPLRKIIEAEPSLAWLNPETNPGIRYDSFMNSLFFMDPASPHFGMRKRVRTNKKGEYVYSVDNGEYVTLKIVNTGGLQLKADGNLKEDSSSSTGLNEADKLLQDINMFMKGGFSSILRLSDKTTDLGIFANFYSDPKTGQPYKKILGALEKKTDEAKEGYTNVFTSEPFVNGVLNGLKDFTAVKYLGYKGFYDDLDFASKNILNTWGEFDKILSKNTKALLDEALKSPAMTSVDQAAELISDSKIISSVKEDVRQYFKSYSEEFLNRLRPIEKMVQTKYLTGSKNFRETVNYYLASTFLMDLATMKVFFGTSIHFKDFHKRASKDSATGIFTFLEPSLITALNDYENAQGYGANTNLSGRRLAERLFLQGKITKEQRDQVIANQLVSKEFKSGVIQDVKFNSKQSEKVIQNVEKLYSERFISEENYELFKKSIKEVVEKKYSSADDNKEADGQGYVTFDFYRIISILTTNWGDKQEEVYKKIVEYSHYDDLAEAETDETKKAEYITKRDAVGYDPAEQVYFPPKKFQYSGPMQHEKIIDGNLYNALVPMFDKFSLYPLIPTLIKGTENEDLAKRMEFEGVGYVKFKSGTKTETPKKQDSLYENYDENNPETRYIKTFEQRLKDGDTRFNSQHTIYMTHLKEQVRIDAEVHDDVIFGSQARKLILMNMLSLTTTHNREEFVRLYNQYKGLIDDLVQIEKTMIYDKLGIVSKDGQLQLKDITKMVDYFTKEISKKNQDSNVLKALSYDAETGKFKIPLDAAVQAQIIEGIIISSINNNIVRYKASGSMLTQVAITGSAAKKFSKDASQKALETFGNQELKYYDIAEENGKRIVTAMQVKVGLTKQWLPLLELNHEDGNKIGSLERLNESIKDKEWLKKHRNSIRMISYRIPTQGRNFLDVMEVAEFLPAQFGDAIIMPTEAIIKSGSDFDIDKMFVFYPNMSSNGTYAKAEYSKSDLKRLDADLYKGAIQNRLYETMAEIILHPNNYMELVTPSDNFHIDPIVNALYKKLGLMDRDATERPKTDYKHTDILDRNRNIEKFLSLLNGKADLGIAALANTFNVLYQIAEAKGNPDFFKKNNIQSFFSSKFMSKNPDNIISDLYYGDIYDEDGILKSEFFSEFINAFVDVAKDDYVFGVNVVTEFSPMIFYMKFAGLSSKKILAFINQPILRAYTKNLSKYENMFVQNYTNKEKVELEATQRSYTEEEKLESEEYKKLQEDLKDVKSSARRKALAETLREFGFTETNASKPGIKKTLGKVNYSDSFTAKGLFNNIQNIKTFSPDQLSQEQKNLQLAVLYEMLNQREQSDSMTNAQRFLNFDTKPYVSSFDVYVRNTNYQQASAPGSADNVLSPDSLKKIKKDSIISSLDVSSEIVTMLETLLPSRNNRRLNSMLLRKAIELRADSENKNISSEEDMLRFARTAKNDLMTYIVQNFFDKSEKGKELFKELFGTDKSLNEYLKELIETDKLRKRLVEIRDLDDYSDLVEKNPIVENIVVQPGANNKNIITYRFLENSTNPVEKQAMIVQFEELVNFKNESLKDIRDFFRDLALYSVFQSGYNTSDISYTGITPIEIINPIYAAAIEEFEKLSIAQKTEEYEKFFKMFAKNNPGFYSTKKATATITGEISKKGKWYSDIDLNVKRPESSVPESKPKTKLTDNNMEINIPPYYVDSIKAGTKKTISRIRKLKNGVYKATNSENYSILIEVKFYKQLSALDLDTDVKRQSFAKAEGFGSWNGLVKSINEGRTKTLTPEFLTGAQKVNVYLIKYLPEGGKSIKSLPVSASVANIPQNKVSGIESFGSLVIANDEVINALGPNPYSIDMIEAGFRTRTTRSESEMAKYAIKVGDIIKHFGKSADGSTKTIFARVTAIHPKGTPGWKGTWSKEGWRAKDVDVIDRFKDGAAAIEFEVINTTEPTQALVNPLVQAGVKPTDMSGNASKDIQMASESTQFIGFKSGDAKVSSTDKYRQAWGSRANTGNYTSDDVVMVSGSGTFRGVTEDQIRKTLSEKYKPLLQKAVAAGASFRVGNQYAKGNLSDQLVAEYLRKQGYVEQKLNGYSKWSPAAAPAGEEKSPVSNSAKIDTFRELLVESITMTNQEIEAMYEKEKQSGEIMEEFLNRMYCLGKIK